MPDYKKVATDLTLPLKFFSHRWLENIPVCERAIAIWDDIIAHVKETEEKNLPRKSYHIVRQATKDVLFISKIQFFKSVSLHVQPFLVSYQTDALMLPFLSDDLCDRIRTLMRRLIRSDVITTSLPADKLIKIDIEKENQVPYNKVDIGILAQKELKLIKCSEREKIDYRVACKHFLIAVLKKKR